MFLLRSILFHEDYSIFKLGERIHGTVLHLVLCFIEVVLNLGVGVGILPWIVVVIVGT
jgi:hypothetical protein